MMAIPETHKLVEKSQVGIAATLDYPMTTTSLPLSFLDLPWNLKDLDHLVPKLTFTTLHDHDDDTFIFPLVALQTMVFPNHGLCIAITYCHMMGDAYVAITSPSLGLPFVEAMELTCLLWKSQRLAMIGKS
ncbi:hypothetical protein RJT34_28865 [Clitoria ternatea]|uniref:Uncharacterized protein n=1 Tax=Clitoria ternatea TaxID=43366 RepID=A0AAN9FDT6_CLITE